MSGVNTNLVRYRKITFGLTFRIRNEFDCYHHMLTMVSSGSSSEVCVRLCVVLSYGGSQPFRLQLLLKLPPQVPLQGQFLLAALQLALQLVYTKFRG